MLFSHDIMLVAVTIRSDLLFHVFDRFVLWDIIFLNSTAIFEMATSNDFTMITLMCILAMWQMMVVIDGHF